MVFYVHGVFFFRPAGRKKNTPWVKIRDRGTYAICNLQSGALWANLQSTRR
jgi:hypothetical protein